MLDGNLLDGLTVGGLDGLADGITNENNSAPVQETATQTTETASVVTAESNDEYSLTFDRPTFSKLLGTLRIIENICNDVEIHEGSIRAKTNNNKCIINIDLSSVLQDKNLVFSLLKYRLGLLKTFELDMNVQPENNNNDIILQSNQNFYEFIDCFSKMKFRHPLAKFLDNPYIQDNDFQGMINGCNDDSLIFTYSVTNYLKRRISTVCDSFRIDSVKFELHGDHANLAMETKSKEDMSQNSTHIPLLKNIDGKMFTMINLPFSLDVQSDLKISCYDLGGRNGNNLCMCKSELNHFGIPFVLYSKMKLVDIA